MAGARIGKGNLKVLSALLLIALILAAGLVVFSSQPPQEASAGAVFPDCSWGCTANDVNITNVRLTDSTGAELDPCTPGDTAEAYIMAEIHNGAGKDRYAFWLVFNLHINGNMVEYVSECVAESVAGKDTVDLQIYPNPNDQTADPIIWECGDQVQLKGLVLSWSTNAETCADPKKCASRGTSQCYSSDEPLIVRAPLVADFNISDHCFGTTVEFEDKTTGGAKPYDYSWDFGDSIGNSAEQNPSYQYGNPGTYTVNLTVTDSDIPPFSDWQTHDVTVWELPEASANSNSPKNYGDPVLFTGNAINGTPLYTFDWDFTNDGIIDVYDNQSVSYDYSEWPCANYTARLLVTDSHGCQDEDTTFVELVCCEPPVITCPNDLTLECGNVSNEATYNTWLDSAYATEGCGNVIITSDGPGFVDLTPKCAPGTGITVQWTATDNDFNTDTCTAVVKILDNTPPTISCPTDVTLECDESSSPDNTGYATATDNCGTPTVTYTNVEYLDGCNGTGFIERTWTATDDCGNSASCVQIITVVDNTPPTISCPADVTLGCNPADTSPTATGSASATDNCDTSVDINYSDSTSTIGCVTTITRTWTATDDCGNQASCDQIVTYITDTTLPVITCPPDVIIDEGASISPSNTGIATATDDCDANPVITYSDITTGTCPEIVITRTWTATDDCGNIAQCEQTITIICGEPPPSCRPEIQLAMLLDGSSTMNDPGEWDTQINGLYDAIRDPDCIPDCYVELTVIQFASGLPGGAYTEVGPIVITDGNRKAVAEDVRDIVKSAGTTTMEAGINLAVEVLSRSPNFGFATTQIINISSDVQENTLDRTAIKKARDNAINPIDQIFAEGIGDFRIPEDQDWLTSEILYPQPGHVAPGSWEPGWVYAVGTDPGKFKEAICNKIGLVNHVPVAVDDDYSTKENTTLNWAAPGVLANDYDADGNTLTAIPVSDVSNGTLTLNANGSFIYIPIADFNGSDSFTYKANDGIADSNVATVSITVTSVGPGPGPVAYMVIEPDDASITAGDTLPYYAYVYDASDNYIGNVTSETTFSIEAGAGGGWDPINTNIYTSQYAGTWTVTGLYEGKSDNAKLTVVAGSLSYIVIEPEDATITTGKSQEYNTETFDAQDNFLDDVTVDTVFSIIEPDDGGSWADNVYTSDNVGVWTVNGTYLSFYDTATLTVRSSGGGGGGGGITTQTFTVVWDDETTTASMTTSGRLLESLSATSADGLNVLEIRAGTTTLDSEGEVVNLIEVTEATAPPLAAGTAVVGQAFDFGPGSMVFSKPVGITLGYNITDLPDDTIALNMVHFIGDDGSYEIVETEDSQTAELGFLTGQSDSFSIYAILAEIPAFEVSDLAIDPSRHEIWGFPTFVAREGEEALITADVTNTGNYEATYTANLQVNGETVDSQTITLAPEQTGQVEFTISDIETGDYEIALGDQSTEFESFFWINWLLIGIIIGALILLVLFLGWLYAKRKKTAQQPA